MEFEPVDRAIYVPGADAIVCADLHVGKDAASNVEFELGEREDLLDRLSALVTRYEPTEVIVAGDLLHSFGDVPAGVMKTVEALTDVVRDVGADVVVTPGNHDPMLSELWDGPTHPEYRLESNAPDRDVIIAHGHVPPAADADVYVVGHDHPTIEIEGRRRPCYLYGPGQYGDAELLMLPSFSRLPAGASINRMSSGDFQSPLLTDVDALRPIVLDSDAGEAHEFPPLGEFRRLL